MPVYFLCGAQIMLDMLQCSMYAEYTIKPNKGLIMKSLAAVLLFLLSAHAAQAQQATTTPPVQQQQASVDPYIASITPQQPVAQEHPAPQQPAPEARPWEYGQSVITDIRQMNF